MNAIGKSVKRVDARDKVTGKALYAGDLNRPDQTYMKVLFAGRPHAIVKSIDAQKAEALEGVIAVFTAKDVPVNEYGLQRYDQPVLCGPGSDKPYADRVRFVGDQVAAVVAESEAIAQKALDLITVTYEDLPLLYDPFEALEEDAILLHPDWGTNILEEYRIRKGDVEEGFREADVIVESTYHTPAQEHVYMEPEAGMAYIDEEGRVTVVMGAQWAHEEREQVAHALDLEEEQVRIIHPPTGGAFGGREDISIQIVLGLAAMRLHERGIDRPVKMVWSREESIIGHHKRHPYHIKTRWGATQEGKITAIEVDITADGGAYMYTSNKVLANATLMCAGPYLVPNVKVDARAVCTNRVPGGAFRGFGGPQGVFAAECQISKLAEALDMDPVEIRIRNALHEGDLLSVQTPLPGGVSIPQVISRCAEESGWEESDGGWRRKEELVDPRKPYLKRGIGFACGFKNVGFSLGYRDNAWATIELYGGEEIGEVVVRQAGADTGQGAHTVITQMAAEAVGVPLDRVRLVTDDTGKTQDSGSNSASRLTFMSGNSVRGAAEIALQKWEAGERPAIGTYQYLAPPTSDYDPETGESKPNFSYGYVAQAAEVEVDTETGQITVLHFVSVNDVGKAINPEQVEGQIEGGVTQALGYVLTEDFIQEDGYVKTDKLSTYLMPTVRDIPAEVRSVILEHPDPNGPWGARGMGEMPFIPTAPAVVAAVQDAIGIWFDEFPLTPERVVKGLRELS
ncbi:MAG: xanthine dehydrogenase family protein molybdopterin-binding subunit [Anaerolineales bacterium]